MNRFGLPLVPAALALWAINFIDRLFISALQGPGRGRHLLARGADLVGDRLPDDRVPARLARVRVLDRGRRRRRSARTRTCSPTCSSSAAGCRSRSASLAPWIVEHPRAAKRALRPRRPRRSALLCFATTAYAGYTVLAIGIGRARQTQFNWIVTGVAAVVNIALNFALIPPLRDDGRRGRDARRVRRALRRDVAQHAARLPGAVPVAARADAARRRRRARPSLGYELRLAAGRDRAQPGLPARCCCRSASTSRPSARDSGASCRSAARGGAAADGEPPTPPEPPARAQGHRARAAARVRRCRSSRRRRPAATAIVVVVGGSDRAVRLVAARMRPRYRRGSVEARRTNLCPTCAATFLP